MRQLHSESQLQAQVNEGVWRWEGRPAVEWGQPSSKTLLDANVKKP